MIKTKNKYLIPLEDNSTLWRYVDFNKFKSMLKSKSLFFCRADCFQDKFEGSIPKKEHEFRKRKSKDSFEGFSIAHKKVRKSSVVSCWNIGENESTLMWSLYSKEKGIAIKTSKERLYESLANSKEKVWPTKVRYIDYESDSWYRADYPHGYNFTAPIIHKRIEYQDEREFRLIIYNDRIENIPDFWEKQPKINGFLVEVDIYKLIDKIVLSPYIETCTKKNVAKIADEFGILVEDSKLSSEPLF